MTYRNLFCAISMLVVTMTAIAAPAGEPSLKDIMQGLRDDLVVITDGLLLDDFDVVAQGATGIAQHSPISAAEVKRIAAALGPEMRAFKQFDKTVHDLSVAIASAARKDDREAIVTDYQRLVNGCLACHGAFKGRLADALNQTP